MESFRIRLQARDPARDCFRSYRIEAGTDLFGAWLVEATYGRIGSPGRTVRHVAYRLHKLHVPTQWLA